MRIALLLLAAVIPAAAQPKKLVNAQVDTQSAAAGLERSFRPLLARQPQPAWIGYAVPASRGRQFGCDGYWREGEFAVAGGTVYLEPPSEVLVLFRVDAGQVGRIRTLAPGCDVDGGGVTLHWLTDVRPAESVALLAAFAAGPDRSLDSALSALSLHADAAADAALERFVAADQPEGVRQRAVTWLGTRGRRGLESLRKILAGDASDRVRERALQSLGRSQEPEAMDLAVATARSDRSPRVRGQALAWLARRQGVKAAAILQQAIETDPEREVRRRAVSALRELPNGEGIPLLIQLARTGREPEIRKQAMSSLGQSKDPRAVAFFEDVLKSRP